MSPQIEAVLRGTLSAEAASLGSAGDPWPEFSNRERKHKRTRRIRQVAVAAAIVAVAGFQSSVVPMPTWVPGIAVTGTQAPIVGGPTRGPLAGATTFLEGLRAEIKDVEDPGELWRINDRSKIKFVYAGDVGDRRLALAVVPLRFGLLTDQALMWFDGPAGASAQQMDESSREDASTVVTTHMTSGSDGPGHVVVVGPAGSTVSISTGFRYSAEGRIVRNPPKVFAAGAGFGELILPASPIQPGVTATVVKDGETLYDSGVSGGWSSSVDDEATGAMVDQALRGSTFDREMMQQWVDSSLMGAQLPAAGTTMTLRWTGQVNGKPAALFTFSRPDSGVLAFALHGDLHSYRDDFHALFPAAGIDDRPIAWRMRAEGKDDRSDQVIVTAPTGAARVELTVPGAPPVEVQGTSTTLDPYAKATVTAYRADGTKMGETPVLPFDDGGTMIGETPANRVVK